MKKLPAGSQIILMPMLLSLLMSGIVASIATMAAVGVEPELAGKILRAWGFSYAIAFPTAVVVLPLVRRIVGTLVEPA